MKTYSLKFFTMVLTLIFAEVLIISTATSALINEYVYIRSIGKIGLFAESGSVEDIQAAVDEAVRAGGGTVFIPSGTFVFNASGNRRVNIDVPIRGINIIGAGINKTILEMPEDDLAPNTNMFYVIGSSHGPLRISGITFKGRPNADSPTGDTAIYLASCRNFRIDHCSLYNLGYSGITVNDHVTQYGIEGGDPDLVSQGVIDHNYFYNIFKEGARAANRGLGYGISLARAWHYRWTVWNDDIWASLGVYDKNIFIEDNYFIRTRHAVAASGGQVYVFRHNIVEDQEQSESSITGHPVRRDVYGMRAFEVYDNIFRYTGQIPTRGIHIEGGGALVYNNTLQDLIWGIGLGSCEYADNVFYPRGSTRDVWIWNNTFVNNTDDIITWSNEAIGGCPAPVEGADYFLQPPPPERDYTPYPYPHPLTQD